MLECEALRKESGSSLARRSDMAPGMLAGPLRWAPAVIATVDDNAGECQSHSRHVPKCRAVLERGREPIACRWRVAGWNNGDAASFVRSWLAPLEAARLQALGDLWQRPDQGPYEPPLTRAQGPWHQCGNSAQRGNFASRGNFARVARVLFPQNEKFPRKQPPGRGGPTAGARASQNSSTI